MKSIRELKPKDSSWSEPRWRAEGVHWFYIREELVLFQSCSTRRDLPVYVNKELNVQWTCILGAQAPNDDFS